MQFFPDSEYFCTDTKTLQTEILDVMDPDMGSNFAWDPFLWIHFFWRDSSLGVHKSKKNLYVYPLLLLIRINLPSKNAN